MFFFVSSPEVKKMEMKKIFEKHHEANKKTFVFARVCLFDKFSPKSGKVLRSFLSFLPC